MTAPDVPTALARPAASSLLTNTHRFNLEVQ
jgi:hypothetical protein